MHTTLDIEMTDLKNFFSSLEENKKEMVCELRETVRGISSDITEGIKWNVLCFFKDSRPFVGIMPYKNYVSVIFDRGSEMTDELGVLEGSGKQMRHIKLRSMDEVSQKRVADYISQSYSI